MHVGGQVKGGDGEGGGSEGSGSEDHSPGKTGGGDALDGMPQSNDVDNMTKPQERVTDSAVLADCLELLSTSAAES